MNSPTASTPRIDPYKQAWAKTIRAHRERRGLSQADLAAEIGVVPSAVNQWEQQVAAPNRDSQRRLRTALAITDDELANVYAKAVR